MARHILRPSRLKAAKDWPDEHGDIIGATPYSPIEDLADEGPQRAEERLGARQLALAGRVVNSGSPERHVRADPMRSAFRTIAAQNGRFNSFPSFTTLMVPTRLVGGRHGRCADSGRAVMGPTTGFGGPASRSTSSRWSAIASPTRMPDTASSPNNAS